MSKEQKLLKTVLKLALEKKLKNAINPRDLGQIRKRMDSEGVSYSEFLEILKTALHELVEELS